MCSLIESKAAQKRKIKNAVKSLQIQIISSKRSKTEINKEIKILDSFGQVIKTLKN